MVTIGYMAGTDPGLLTKLCASGATTVPLGNGWDNHGQYIALINAGDRIDAVVGYLHKFLPTMETSVTPSDLLKSCKVNGVRVFVIADKADHENAKKVLGDISSDVTIVDPGNASTELVAFL
ncbi:MAG: hypothetical protein GY771_01325 [bacterium]|nr:hypothetical protein [bacterium]